MSNAAVSDPQANTANASHSLNLWLALTLTPGLGPTRAKRLVEFFGGVQGVFRATLTELEAAGLPAQAAQSLATGRSIELAQDEIAKSTAAGIQCVSLDDPRYQPRLRQIYDPPLVLYVRGSVEVLSRPGIAVIGTRHPTPYGIGMAERLACDLAARNVIIPSGLARGVDTAAHRGAVSAKAKTVAVFGTGVDVIYPKENSRLTEQILSLGGALISEFPLAHLLHRKTSQFGTGSSAVCRLVCWWSRLPSTAGRGSRRDAPSNKIVKFLRCRGTSPTKIPGDRTR